MFRIDDSLASWLLVRHIVRTSHKTQSDVLVESSVISPHVPLRIRVRVFELEERVPRWVIKRNAKWHKRLICADGTVLRALSVLPLLVLVIVVTDTSIFILLALFNVQDISQFAQNFVDLIIRRWVHNLSDRLTDVQISDGVTDNTLDRGQLSSASGDGKLNVGNVDRGKVRLDHLTVKLSSVEDVNGVVDSLS